MKNILLVFLLASTGLTCTASETSLDQKNAFELGLALQYLVPNKLADFEIPITAFGPRAAIPLGINSLDLQALYGGSDIISLLLIETSYRLNIPTPFFTSFFYGGIHYLHYGYLAKDHTSVGPLTGMAFYFPMTKDFKMGLGMKLYLAEKIMLTFGGSFAFLL